MSVVLKVENLSKQYRLGDVGTGTLSHDLNRWWHKVRGKEDPYLQVGETNDRTKKGSSDYVWALKDINFEVKQGEILGIIGKNGAGKSTLLKILSKVTAPTTGRIRAKGRIASLLEVGTGFHPELTGRENIFLNGAILGMTKAEIRAKLDEIVDFAGIEKYLDTPVKRYSSGMTVRLGFAVAAHLEPEILIVDEVLAVGDAEFQKKAIGKMQDVSKGEGRTVLFVSHNMGSVQQLCNRGVLLKNGGIDYIGNIKNTIDQYLNLNTGAFSSSYQKETPKPTDIISIQMLNAIDRSGAFRFDEPIELSIKVKIEEIYAKNIVIGYRVINTKGVTIFATQKGIGKVSENSDVIEFGSIIPPKVLTPNSYSMNFGLHIPNQQMFTHLQNVLQFTIEETGSAFTAYQGSDYGCVFMDCEWFTVNQVDANYN